MVYFISRFLCFLIFKIVFRFEVRGKEYIPKKGGFILASNHVSYLDPIAVGVACPRKLNFMARHDLFSNHWFSWLMSRVGAFAIKRDSADLSALKKAMQYVRNGEPIVLFPEGSRRFNGTSTEPQPGIGFLAMKLNVPVIPALIKGTQEALPRGSRFIKPAKVSLYFGKQILMEKGMTYQEIARLIMESIKIIDRREK
jgi:1-acyl-sn-glycerol-3-phosphate acyltransferase